MPNEPVQCPNCGSGDVCRLARDSYACEHCHSSFRWVDPTKRTVVHESKLCQCGHVAAAHCVRCGEPLCERHGASGTADLDGLSSEQREYYYRRMTTPSTTPQYKDCKRSHRIPDNRDAVVCTACADECVQALRGLVSESLRDTARHSTRPQRTAPPQVSSWLARLGKWLGFEK